jgi:hypothetical protein
LVLTEESRLLSIIEFAIQNGRGFVYVYYNFCCVHSTLHVTPAMEVFEDKKVNAIDEPWASVR